MDDANEDRCVVHRFGADIAGGSEAHCRHVAERLAAQHDVTVLTTCAKDHITWRNEYPAGEHAHRIGAGRAFPVVRQRSLHRFKDISDMAFSGTRHRRRTGASGSAKMVRTRRSCSAYLRDARPRVTIAVLFWAFRYAEVYFGLPLVADRAILVPTAEEDPVIRMDILGRFFTLPAGFIFLTPEEQTSSSGASPARCRRRASSDPGSSPPGRIRSVRLERLGVTKPFVLYLGRIDPNKGCETLLQHFIRFKAEHDAAVQLVMAGPVNMPIPDHPARQACSGSSTSPCARRCWRARRCSSCPSRFESLSLVLLEGWNHGLPALVNGHCSVLKGQALRANGALYYHNYDEFARALEYLLDASRGRARARPPGAGLRRSRIPMAACRWQN